MTEPDFETYLTLLSKLLQLTRGQQAEITSELRDHLEQRFAELLSQGHPRETAVRLALDELGDAAVLAGEFAPSLQIRRRRLLMRYSLLSVSAVAVTFVVASLTGPTVPEPGVRSVVAVAQELPGAPPGGGQPAPVSEEELRQQVEAKLARRDVPLEFQDVPLHEVLQRLGDVLEIDFLVDQVQLTELGIGTDTLVNLHVRHGGVSVRTALDLVLKQAGSQQLSYSIRDGLVIIAGLESDFTNEVYDCRDLIAGVHVESRPGLQDQPTGMMGGGGGGFFQVGPLTETVLTQLGGGAGGGMGGGMPGMPGMPGMSGAGGGGAAGNDAGVPEITATSLAGRALIGVVQRATAPATWHNLSGEGGTISEYDGLLIVHHNPAVHRRIEELLKKLRAVRSQSPAVPGNLPPGMMGPGMMGPGGPGGAPRVIPPGGFPGAGAPPSGN